MAAWWMDEHDPILQRERSHREKRIRKEGITSSAGISVLSNELVYNEGDISDAMYIVQRGLAATAGFVIASGNFFGEDFVLQSARRKHSARALTYLSTYALTWEDLSDSLKSMS